MNPLFSSERSHGLLTRSRFRKQFQPVCRFVLDDGTIHSSLGWDRFSKGSLLYVLSFSFTASRSIKPGLLSLMEFIKSFVYSVIFAIFISMKNIFPELRQRL